MTEEAKGKVTKNYAASVRAQLLALARERKANFQLVLTRFALERLLFRLSLSPYADHFLLKGAMLFAIWMNEPHRPTRDLDLLGTGDPSVESLEGVFRSLCAIMVPEDGLVFDAGSVRAVLIREENIYGGVRVIIAATLEKARIPLQIDVGFGDSVVPEPEVVVYPTLIKSADLPPPRLRAYRRETVIAEKFEAMVSLGMANSRMKDFYDLFFLMQRFDFSRPELVNAIRATFSRRGPPIPAEPPVALTVAFSKDTEKVQQWSAFTSRLSKAQASREREIPSLDVVVNGIASFLLPLLDPLQQGEGAAASATWKPGGPWNSGDAADG